MAEYKVILSDEVERFLDLYLKIHPLRSEHTRADYPSLIANNFINSMMKRTNEFKGVYKDMFGEEYPGELE